jgi:hypothetical protein
MSLVTFEDEASPSEYDDFADQCVCILIVIAFTEALPLKNRPCLYEGEDNYHQLTFTRSLLRIHHFYNY